jgi:type I restriction enzyme S subunit
MKHGLKEAHLQAILEVLNTNKKIEKAVLFGSRAMGTHTPESDVDICLFGDDLTLTDQAKLLASMEELPMPQQVDLVLHNRIKEKKLLEHIEREGVVWVGKISTVGEGVETGKGWVNTTIGEQATLQRGIDITKTQQRLGSVPVVSSGGISSFHDTAGVKGPGVVLGKKGVVGSVYYIEKDYWPHDTTLWVKDFHGNEPRFVYYFFKWQAPILASMDVGSANPTLNRNHVHPIAMRWPPKSEQRAIAHILGALDDKIELNRKMNETLESMARALFKSWFVDFDPVRARAANCRGEKCRGEKFFAPTCPPEILDLFPSEFQDSELGEIPKGWRAMTLGSITRYLNRGFGPSYLEEGGIAVLNQKCVRDHKVDFSKARRHDPMKRAISGRQLESWDILVNSTGVRTLGRVAQIISLREQSVIDSHLTVVRADSEKILPVVLGLAFLQRENEIESLAEGSTGQTELSRAQLAQLPFVIPGRAIQEAFGSICTPMREKQDTCDRESTELAILRDILLPRLLSGEISVTQAEHHVGANV